MYEYLMTAAQVEMYRLMWFKLARIVTDLHFYSNEYLSPTNNVDGVFFRSW